MQRYDNCSPGSSTLIRGIAADVFRLQANWCNHADRGKRLMITILIVILIVLLIAALPTWPYSSGWGYYPGGLLGAVLLIVVILLLLGRI